MFVTRASGENFVVRKLRALKNKGDSTQMGPRVNTTHADKRTNLADR